jgi:hypothetical protein
VPLTKDRIVNQVRVDPRNRPSAVFENDVNVRRQAFEWSCFKLDTTDPRLPSTFSPQEMIQKTHPPENGLYPRFLQVCRRPWRRRSASKMDKMLEANTPDISGSHSLLLDDSCGFFT